MNHKHFGRHSALGVSLLAVSLSGVVNAQQTPAAAPPQATESTRLEQRLDQVLAALNGMQHQLDDSSERRNAGRNG
jgi:hypothetical protein